MNVDDAADAMGACLSENPQAEGRIVDWCYSADALKPGKFTSPTPLVPPADTLSSYTEQDVDALFAAARLVNG